MSEPAAGDKSLSVRGTYEFFVELSKMKTDDGNSALEAFLAECDRKGLTFIADDKLYQVGHRHFYRSSRLMAAGPDCPLCP